MHICQGGLHRPLRNYAHIPNGLGNDFSYHCHQMAQRKGGNKTRMIPLEIYNLVTSSMPNPPTL